MTIAMLWTTSQHPRAVLACWPRDRRLTIVALVGASGVGLVLVARHGVFDLVHQARHDGGGCRCLLELYLRKDWGLVQSFMVDDDNCRR